MSDGSLKVIGEPRRRVDGRAKVTGQTRFADDITFPRMLHCKLLRSTVPHARIVSIDTSRAEALEGVHLVLTGDAFPIAYGVLPVSHDEHALCPDKVRHVGDPVAAVIARTETIAEDALHSGRGTRLEMTVPSGLTDAAVAQLQEDFAWLGDHGVQVSVRRQHHAGPLGARSRPHAAA